MVVGVFNIIRTSFSDPEEQVAPPAVEQTESPDEDPTEDADDSVAAVDREAVVVAVFNGSGVTGAGAAFAEATEANGWIVDEVGNYQTPDPSSTVYYSTADQEVQAAALAEELGIEQIEESGDFSADLTVVVASDIAEQGPPDAGGGTAAPEEGADG
nr:LytR C-terminal domain-containing protein [Brevibacterium yomogidense]